MKNVKVPHSLNIMYVGRVSILKSQANIQYIPRHTCERSVWWKKRCVVVDTCVPQCGYFTPYCTAREPSALVPVCTHRAKCRGSVQRSSINLGDLTSNNSLGDNIQEVSLKLLYLELFFACACVHDIQTHPNMDARRHANAGNCAQSVICTSATLEWVFFSNLNRNKLWLTSPRVAGRRQISGNINSNEY